MNMVGKFILQQNEQFNFFKLFDPFRMKHANEIPFSIQLFSIDSFVH